jgi:pimeloyl-ACP methyl ester carboxylesterase
LETLIRKNPDLALQKLKVAVAGNAKHDEIAALAALTVRYGRELERTQPEKAAELYLTAATLAYQNFANKVESSATNLSNSLSVQAYNQATLGVVILLQRLPDGLRTNHILSLGGQSVRLETQAGDSDSDPRYYDQWFAADQWKQRGLTHNYRLDGLGARLVAFRTNRQATALELRQADEGIFHASTAILRFQSGESESAGQTQAVKLVFYNPTLTPEIEVNSQSCPLAADFTMPWATLLSRTRPLFKTRWTGLMHPSETPRQHRLYLMQPYSPDRIPVIMVHGLRSTPLAWEELTNELMGDPVLGRRYQLWHYLYPTGLPFLTSAADFRDELEDVRKIVDPSSHDFATHHMVVIGHSMGGLLARTLVTDSGDAIWNSTFAIPADELDPHLEQVAQLRRIFYFQAKPYVERAIFMGVPHHGSKIADGVFARFVSGRVALSDALNQFVFGLNKTYPGLLTPEAAPVFKHGYPTSIRVLSPTTPGLVSLAKLPVGAATPFHSIIGDRGLGGGEKSSDGAVPYWSSHLPGASSETIVPANHRTYESPEAIAEVKRILRLHLAALTPQSERSPTAQAGGAMEKQSP